MPEKRFLPNKLTYGVCITIPELVRCGITETYIYSALSLQRSDKLKCWPHHKEGNQIYLHYDGLSEKYQELVKLHICGGADVEEFVNSQVISENIVLTNEIAEFFLTYKFPNGDSLERTRIPILQHAASLLRFMSQNKSKQQKLCALKITDINEYYNKIALYIRLKKLPIPTNKGNLITKVKEFEKYGCECLISKRIGNNNSCKVLTKEQNALLEAIASDYRNLDAAQISMTYNEVALKLGWKPIHRETARQYKKKHGYVTIAGSMGLKEWEKRFSIQHDRIEPSMPLLYATLDGWDCELMYQNQVVNSKNHLHREYANRHAIVIVLDPYNKYPLGYAIGEQESSELIKTALKNTMDHIKEITGKYYYPYQLQSDNYSKKKLLPYYQAISHIYTPARVGNAKSKVIEPYFKYLNKNYCQFLPNWSGFGLTARRENQPNRDWLNTTNVKKQFPTKEENLLQIHQIIEKERKLKQEEWLNAFKMMDKSTLYEMTRETYLQTFGMVTGDTNKLKGNGITIQLAGRKFTFDTLDIEFRKHAMSDWTLIIDTNDITSALAISNITKKQFLLTEKHRNHMAIYDQTTDDVAYKTALQELNKNMMSEIAGKHSDNRDTVQKLIQENPVLAETRSKLMLTDNGQQKDNLKIAEKAVRQAAVTADDSDDDDIYVKMFDKGLCEPKKQLDETEEYEY